MYLTIRFSGSNGKFCYYPVFCCGTTEGKRGLLLNIAVSFPEPANFLRRMLDENEGSGKDQFLGDPDWLSEMQYDTISSLLADY